MNEVLIDALPSIVAFIVISILTFIGWGVRKVYLFTHRVGELLEAETSNGNLPGEGVSTKEVLIDIRSGIKSHHEWAVNDAAKVSAALGVDDE